MTAEWKDVTSYRRDEPTPREPRTWRLGDGPYAVVVTKGHIYMPDRWVMHFRAGGIDTRDLLPAERPAHEAQHAALVIARASLQKGIALLGAQEDQ